MAARTYGGSMILVRADFALIQVPVQAQPNQKVPQGIELAWCGLFFLEIALHNDLNESSRIVVGVGIAHESDIATFGYASGNIDIEVIRHIGPRETLMPVRKCPMALRKRL